MQSKTRCTLRLIYFFIRLCSPRMASLVKNIIAGVSSPDVRDNPFSASPRTQLRKEPFTPVPTNTPPPNTFLSKFADDRSFLAYRRKRLFPSLLTLLGGMVWRIARAGLVASFLSRWRRKAQEAARSDLEMTKWHLEEEVGHPEPSPDPPAMVQDHPRDHCCTITPFLPKYRQSPPARSDG
jgi:hypothetical protein